MNHTHRLLLVVAPVVLGTFSAAASAATLTQFQQAVERMA
jgi:hypothetical protein